MAKKVKVDVTAPNMDVAVFTIEGTSPFVQHKFSQKAQEQIQAAQEAGSTTRKGSKRAAKDFQQCYLQAMHVSAEGWHGIPASAFRKAAISACRLVGFAMTMGKLSIFCDADGMDKEDGTPLVKITRGKPHRIIGPARNDNGSIDLRARAMWDAGWQAVVKIRFDADQFTVEDVTNLMMRVGAQVGVGEGRADSPKSTGMGWGFFKIMGKEPRRGRKQKK